MPKVNKSPLATHGACEAGPLGRTKLSLTSITIAKHQKPAAKQPPQPQAKSQPAARRPLAPAAGNAPAAKRPKESAAPAAKVGAAKPTKESVPPPAKKPAKPRLWKGWTTATSAAGEPLWVHETLGLRLTERPVRLDEKGGLVVQPEILYQLIVNHRRRSESSGFRVHAIVDEFTTAMGLTDDAYHDLETPEGLGRIAMLERAQAKAEALVAARHPELARVGGA